MSFNLSDEELKMVLEILSTIAIIGASIVAICGINAWKKEFRGKRKIELAEEVLALFYEAKDAIRAIRNPLGFQGEGKTRKPQENETPKQKAARDRFYFVYERFEKRQEIFNKLHSKRYQVKARFGPEKDKPFEDLKNIIIDIQVSANGLAMILSEQYDNNGREIKDEIRKYESVIRSIGKDDPIVPRVEQIILDIEAICRPIIMGSSK